MSIQRGNLPGVLLMLGLAVSFALFEASYVFAQGRGGGRGGAGRGGGRAMSSGRGMSGARGMSGGRGMSSARGMSGGRGVSSFRSVTGRQAAALYGRGLASGRAATSPARGANGRGAYTGRNSSSHLMGAFGRGSSAARTKLNSPYGGATAAFRPQYSARHLNNHHYTGKQVARHLTSPAHLRHRGASTHIGNKHAGYGGGHYGNRYHHRSHHRHGVSHYHHGQRHRPYYGHRYRYGYTSLVVGVPWYYGGYYSSYYPGYYPGYFSGYYDRGYYSDPLYARDLYSPVLPLTSTTVVNPNIVDNTVVAAANPAAAPVIPTSGSAIEYQRQAEQAFMEKRYADAARLSDHAMVEDPGNGYLHLFAGQVLIALGEYRTAAAAIHQGAGMLKAEERGFVVKNNARLYSPGEYDLQLQQLDNYIASNPMAAYAYFLRGFQNLYLGRDDIAQRSLESTLKLEPADTLARELLIEAGGTPPAAPAPAPAPGGMLPAPAPAPAPARELEDNSLVLVDGGKEQ